MPTRLLTTSLGQLRLLVLGALIAGALLFMGGVGTARAYDGIFCYNKYLYPRGNAYDHCFSNYVSFIQTATNNGYRAASWAGIYTTAEGWHGDACYSSGCTADAQSSYPGYGFGENANLSGFGDWFFGYLYSYRI